MQETKRPVQAAESSDIGEDGCVIEMVIRAIAATGRFSLDRLEVTTSEGNVRLRGRVASYYQKQLAQVAALRVIGARQLFNDIEVA